MTDHVQGPVLQKLDRLFPLVVALTIAVGVIMIVAPFRSDTIEMTVNVAAIGCMGLVAVFCWAYGLTQMWYSNGKVATKPAVGTVVLMVLMALFVFFPIGVRHFRAGLLRRSLDGVILRKYNSNNHHIESIEISTNEGPNVFMEGIDPIAWHAFSVGDLIVKSAWSPYAQVNDEKVRLVPPGLLDSVRGIE